MRVGGASGRCATDGASGRRELAAREAADKQTAETASEMMARGSEGASEQGWFSSTHPRHLSGGVRRSHSAVSHERGNRVRAGGRGGVEWGTLSPDHRRRPRCAVVDQVERRARDSRELALELAQVRELGDARAREVDVVQESYLWCGRRAASAGGG